MVDEINALIGRLNEAGSALAIKNLFHRETVQLENKPRPMRDFAEVDLGPDPTVGTFVVMVHNEAVLPNAIAILKENGFINIDTRQTEIEGSKTAPHYPARGGFRNSDKKAWQKLNVKGEFHQSDAMQRLTAAIKAEYIDPPVAQKARIQLDELGDEARKHIVVLSLIRRKQLVGGGISFDGPEEESLYRRVNDSAYKEVTAELLKVEAQSE